MKIKRKRIIHQLFRRFVKDRVSPIRSGLNTILAFNKLANIRYYLKALIYEALK